MERVTFHRRVDLKAGWLSSQRHGFLAARSQSLIVLLSIGLIGLMPVMWGVRQMLAWESMWLGSVGGIVAVSVAMALGAIYVYRYRRYRVQVATDHARFGDGYTQEISINRHGVRFMQTGEAQLFYPWWQVGYSWQRRRLVLHLFLSGHVLRVRYSDLSPRQIEQIKGWIEAARQPYTKCKQCGYDLRGSHGPSCPECGCEIPAHHVPTF
ncbi:hypothetical protein KS4_31690 [Poriferisphaera corsica]|uniref:Uncharacterized protein n=1 Tax=Poriferisphaera corsica TaxID=2528020 RepID=A0A517YXZ6_9BACT|nr:hypothetical protein [Poriferisphaera corsica]QDU35091.1 hypothetical protein KS4_31690 [Poriferisphaera corsica]